MQDKLKELEKKHSVDWREFEIGELFEIRNTLGFNKDKLVLGNEYDYVTRTSQNQGILQETGFVNQEHLNPPGIWSLGLLQMDFFYRKKPWYAGQFVRKIIPKRDLSKNAVLYFTVLLNKQKKNLLSGLVRDVDKTFLTAVITLPTVNNEIAFAYIDEFIATLKAERLATLEAYLLATGLKDTELSKEERSALDLLRGDALRWREYEIGELFEIKHYGTQISTDSFDREGVPEINFVMQNENNNGIVEKVPIQKNHQINLISGNSISAFTHLNKVYYQEEVFYSKQGSNVYTLKSQFLNKGNALYFVGAINSQIKNVEYGKNTASRMKAKPVQIPIKSDGQIDYDFMITLMSAIQKQVIKGVVEHLDERIDRTNKIIKDF